MAASFAAMMASVSTAALAQAPNAPHTMGDNEAIFIDGKTLTVAPGRAKDDIGSQLGNLNVRPLGPGAIIFRAGDKLYVIDGAPMGSTYAMYDDPGIDRQRSYGGFYDSGAEWRRQQSYGGLYDPANDRQRSYGGLNDDRQRSYGGLNDDRQRSYGGFYDSGAESRRQQSYGGLNDDRQRSYGGLNDDRQRSYGGFYDSGAESRRQQSYGGLNDDRQRSYGGFYDSGAEFRRPPSGGHYDPDYANYRLNKVFGSVWGGAQKN
jgi:hypothetical protein